MVGERDDGNGKLGEVIFSLSSWLDFETSISLFLHSNIDGDDRVIESLSSLGSFSFSNLSPFFLEGELKW